MREEEKEAGVAKARQIDGVVTRGTSFAGGEREAGVVEAARLLKGGWMDRCDGNSREPGTCGSRYAEGGEDGRCTEGKKHAYVNR